MPTAEPKRRWFRLTPDRFVISLLLVIGLLWLSERFQWFGFNHHKGWTVLISVAAVGVAALVMLLWWAVGLIFRCRFQFGIRSLLTFCLVCSVVVSWFAVEWKDARRQAEAVEGINSVGMAGYDWQVDGDPEPPAPGWLLKTLGVDFFATVVFIDYNPNSFLHAGTEQITDAGLEQITDAGLEHLTSLAQLRVLDLSYTNITDAGLEHLKGLTQLRELILSSTTITDAGLEHLTGLTQLRELYLNYTQITDAGLEHIKGLTQLRELILSSTTITDAGLEHLTGLTQLRELYLNYTQITDAGLEHIKGLTQLRELYLNYTNITDAGLNHLKGLTQLRELDLSDTKITDAGMKKLQQALPNCKINH